MRSSDLQNRLRNVPESWLESEISRLIFYSNPCSGDNCNNAAEIEEIMIILL